MFKKVKMMSAGDGPDVATAAATVATAPSGGDNAKSDDTEMKHVWKFIYIDMSFVKSLYGIFVAAELIWSLLGLISVSVPKNEGCAYLYSSAYSYYEFTASSCFIVSMVWYFLYLFAITKKLGFVRWDIAEIVWIAFFILNYLIASSVIAAKACGQGGYNAAAAFGFFCWGVLIAHEFFEIRSFLEKRNSNSAGRSQGDEEESKY